jgi:branched-chain amino acid transport system substrate-binding protein
VCSSDLDEYPDINTWGGFMPDHEYGRTLWAIITDAFARHKEKNPNRSLKLIEAVWVPYGAGDYKNYITKMMGSPVEGLFNTAYGGDAVTLYRQAAPYGLFDKVRVIGDPANELLIPGTMKSEMPKNYWICPYWYEGLNRDNPISVDLYDKYVTKTANKSPSGWIAEGHAAVLAYAKAISIAGPDAGTRAIIATLKGMDFMSASGSRKVRPEDNQAIAPIHIMKLQPDSGSELGYKVELQYKTDGSKEIEPPNPGKPLALKKL